MIILQMSNAFWIFPVMMRLPSDYQAQSTFKKESSLCQILSDFSVFSFFKHHKMITTLRESGTTTQSQVAVVIRKDVQNLFKIIFTN